MSLKIDSEFKNLIPPLTSEEYQQLEENLVKEGCIDALITWGGTLVDGHNRYEICTRRKICFDTKEREFENRGEVKEWIIRHQFGRRNITTAQRCDLVLKLEDVIKARASLNQLAGKKLDLNPKSDEGTKAVNTNEELGKLAGVSHNTIHQFRVIKNEGEPELQRKVLKNEVSINKAYQEIRKPRENKKVAPKPNKLDSKEKEEKAKDIAEMERLYAECKSDYIEPTKSNDSLINISEFNDVVNSFIAGMTKYSFMREVFKALSLSDKEKISTSLRNAEFIIDKIKSQII